jgi:hypothetical protein
MNDTEKLQKMQKQNRERQAKYYNTHKEAINQKRRELYAKGKMIQPEPQPEPQPETPPETQPEPQPQPQPVLKPQGKTILKKNKEELVTHLNYDGATKILDSLDMQNSTRTVYKDGLKRLLIITKCDDIVTCLKRPADVTKAIVESKYSLNTNKATIQGIVFMIDKMKLAIPRETFVYYHKLLETYKLKSKRQTEEKANDQSLTFTDYLKLVKDKFGVQSKMYLISKMYESHTLRDNFGLIVTDKTPTDKTKNYINIKPKQVRIYIYKFKTKNKYEPVEELLSLELSKLIKDYVARGKIQLGSYLFGTEKLGSYIKDMNKQIGIDKMPIDNMRRMKVTEEYANPNSTDESKVNLAFQMGHSVGSQKGYKRNKKTADTT